jgi:hypothetical protein
VYILEATYYPFDSLSLIYRSYLLVFPESMGPTIRAAVMAHLTPIFWSWRDTSKVCLGLKLPLYLLHWTLTYPLRQKQASSEKNVGFGSRTLPCTASKTSYKNSFSCNSLLQIRKPVLFYRPQMQAFCLVYLLCKTGPAECTSFTNLQITDEAATQAPEYLRRNLPLHGL